MKEGLSRQEAAERLLKYGYNEWNIDRSPNIWQTLKEVMGEPMFLLLLACGILYVIIGDYREGAILLAAFSVIMGITFLQTLKTRKTLDALKALSAPRVLVRREGNAYRIPSRELVPGDVMLLSEGDRISADALLVSAVQLTLDESVLTGESVPVHKSIQQGENMVYAGTLVVKGSAEAEVQKTAGSSEVGGIALSLESIKTSATPLHHELKKLTGRLATAGVLISVAVIVFFYITRKDLVQAVLTGLSSAMAIMPEEFPVVLTVFMALGAWRLSSKQVLTRSPSAIETLGSATVLCTDKTGTLTQNRMTLAHLSDGMKLYGLSQFALPDTAMKLLKAAAMACREGTADPIDNAVLREWQSRQDVQESAVEPIWEMPLDTEKMFMAMAYKDPDSDYVEVFCKGAPEAVFYLCRPENEIELNEHLQQQAREGYRLLGMATARIEGRSLPLNMADFSFSFIGFAAFYDPVRPEVPDAMKACVMAGIRPVMITGDYPVTAASIAQQAGMPTGEIITGDELQALPPDVLQPRIKKAVIFARVTPMQKLTIVNSLKQSGEVVIMTGDGVNDAPALKAADIGIAMGNRGTDVAREAASLVLLDDHFASIVAGIRMGRRIFDNLQKAMVFIFAVHIPIIGLTLLPAFFPSLPILLMPIHIVFLELIIDPVCAIAFESEAEEPDIMKRPPRRLTQGFFSGREMGYAILKGFALLGIVLFIYLFGQAEGHSAGEVRVMTFSTMVLGMNILIVSGLSESRNFFRELIALGLAPALILSASLLVFSAIVFSPSLQSLFGFELPAIRNFIPIPIAALLFLGLIESFKTLRRYRGNPYA
ncbi:MAG: hypothetical protein RLZZ161_1901 [Bacteroidota bacterium]